MKILQDNSEVNKKKSIAVLLSTYNGEKFLQKQIDSILNQKDVNVFLFIRDDKSKDLTREIIRRYCDECKNVKWINEDKVENIGIRDSFFTILKYVYERYEEINYFAFADQDDVWLEDKLISGIDAISLSKNEMGALYYSNKVFVDKDLNTIELENIKIYNDFLEILWPSLASGCTMVFNRKLASRVINHVPSINCIHDSWVYRLAKCLGTDIVFDDVAHILYRQHETNVCGMETTKIHHDLKYLINNFVGNLYKHREHTIQDFVREIYTSFEDSMTSEAKKFSKLVLSYNHKVGAKFRLLLIPGIFRRRIKTQLIWFYKVVFNMI